MSAADALTQNVRHAVRFLLKSPGFTTAAVLTLALGVGANAAIFTLIKTVILQPLPYGEPGRVVMVWNAVDRRDTTHLSLQEIVSYRETARTLEDLGTYVETSANLTPLRARSDSSASAGQPGGDDPERVRAAFVSTNLFDTLGVGPLAGRICRPRWHGGSRAPRAPARPRRRATGLLGGPRGGRGSAGAEPRRAQSDRSRLQSAQRPHRADSTADGGLSRGGRGRRVLSRADRPAGSSGWAGPAARRRS